MSDEDIGRYAIIDSDGNVTNIALWNGNLETWSPDPGFTAVRFADDLPISAGWTYADGVFTPPPPPPEIPPTPEEIAASNRFTLQYLTSNAAAAMAPVLVSIRLGDATDEETVLAKAWQTYYRALQAVDLTQLIPAWPTPPAT